MRVNLILSPEDNKAGTVKMYRRFLGKNTNSLHKALHKIKMMCYDNPSYGERSQGVKAVDCGSTIRGFESRRSPSNE